MALVYTINGKRARSENFSHRGMQGREIVFPEVMTDFLTGDTIDLSDVDFTIFMNQVEDHKQWLLVIKFLLCE